MQSDKGLECLIQYRENKISDKELDAVTNKEELVALAAYRGKQLVELEERSAAEYAALTEEVMAWRVRYEDLAVRLNSLCAIKGCTETGNFVYADAAVYCEKHRHLRDIDVKFRRAFTELHDNYMGRELSEDAQEIHRMIAAILEDKHAEFSNSPTTSNRSETG